ncbi:NUDIX domain-containing protein [Stappia sp. ES.058]|uniref:NUDIX hydrolase n=1 Tax=Stappia sp. ES.058 TaxID=1881061 RepID=UPI000879D952|nr:NUDIX hydrolase [Stappia sp. ES.058]SDU49495.1 mutator mutT protein [Stappia sp. ES.058]
MNREDIVSDNISYRYPVSIKGVLFVGDKVVLLKNERDEWELPGGKLEPGERPEDCVVREIEEELGVIATTAELLDNWVYQIREDVLVYIVTFGCPVLSDARVTHSPEHKAVGLFALEDVPALNMPAGYKTSISTWAQKLGMLE